MDWSSCNIGRWQKKIQTYQGKLIKYLENMLKTLYQTEDLRGGPYPFKYGKKHGQGNDYQLDFDLVQTRFEDDPDMCKEKQSTCYAYNIRWYYSNII